MIKFKLPNMISRFKTKLQRPLLFLARPFLTLNPNLISLLGATFSGLFFLSLVKEKYLLSLLAFAGNLLDTIDGMVARETKKVTIFGGFFDSTLDRVADALIIMAFGFAHLVRWEIIGPLLVVSLLISYIRSRAESAGKGKIILNIGLIERGERLILVFLALAIYLAFPHRLIMSFNLIEVFFLLLVLLSTITIFQRFYGAFLRLKEIK